MQSISEKDKSIIIAIIESINKIRKYTVKFETGDDFFNNNLAFDATIMNFVVIGEMVSKLSAEFIIDNNVLDWKNIIGFRNIIAHDYFGIDADEVWEIIQTDLRTLEDYLNKLIEAVL